MNSVRDLLAWHLPSQIESGEPSFVVKIKTFYGSRLSSGTKLGRYEIRSLLGEGGMGEVYLAPDTELGRDVAVKVLPSSFSADRDRLSRFKQEACAAGALNHPNILVLPCKDITSRIWS